MCGWINCSPKTGWDVKTDETVHQEASKRSITHMLGFSRGDEGRYKLVQWLKQNQREGLGSLQSLGAERGGL